MAGVRSVCRPWSLQEFEKKEHKLKARAATNLAFLYSLEGDSANAERYADLAVGTDKYSAQALANKVICSSAVAFVLVWSSYSVKAETFLRCCSAPGLWYSAHQICMFECGFCEGYILPCGFKTAWFAQRIPFYLPSRVYIAQRKSECSVRKHRSQQRHSKRCRGYAATRLLFTNLRS